ncbi:MAG TPA: condensation domain-containing protein [Pyrinomonadaceae bacterium]
MSQTLAKPDNLLAEKAQLIDLLLKKKGITAPRAQVIPRRDSSRPCPLSYAQQRLWFLDQLEPGNSSYNISANLRLNGPLSVSAMERSVGEMVRRHESLRTTFAEVEGQPVQVIAQPTAVRLPLRDLSHLPDQQREAETLRLAAEEARHPFDLSQGPLLRVTLLRLSEQEHVLLVTMHHIISDGWSMGVMVGELTSLYAAFLGGKSSPLAELEIQYPDFAAWQREWLTGERLDAQLSYWREQLAGAAPVLELPTDRPRPLVQSSRGARQEFRIEEGLSRQLKELSQREGCTLFMLLLAAFQVLLYRYSGQEEISVGADIANRNRKETEGLIGFFVNMLVMRTDLSKTPTFRELLGRVREVALGAFAHQDLPFEKIVEELRPERKTSHSPLFQVVFILQNAPMPSFDLEGLTVEPLAFDSGTVRFDLTLAMTEAGGALGGYFTYRTELFNADTIARMQKQFNTLLHSIVVQPETPINALEIETAAEKQERAGQRKELKQSNFKKFKSLVKKPPTVLPEQLITTAPLRPGQSLPLVVRPKVRDVDLALWTESNREFIGEKLSHHGGILFRDFKVDALPVFEKVVRSLTAELLDYNEPSTPRTRVGGQLFTSTEYPAQQPILLHNELSYSHSWPTKLWFFCVQPAQQGGETPIADSRRVFQLLDPKLRERFIEKKVLYVRNYGDGLGLPWQKVFQTESREAVEAYCRSRGVKFEWRGRDRLRTWQVSQAVTRHRRTGEMVWFNQAHVHHVMSLEPEVRESLLSVVEDQEFPLDINAFYGDGSPIDISVLNEIKEAYSESSLPVSWQKGDILMLDNILAAHGRAAFVGPRKIVVAMAEPEQA